MDVVSTSLPTAVGWGGGEMSIRKTALEPEAWLRVPPHHQDHRITAPATWKLPVYSLILI